MVPDICPTNTGSQKTFKMFRKVTFANWEDPKADLLTNQMTDPMSDLMTDPMNDSNPLNPMSAFLPGDGVGVRGWWWSLRFL